MEQEVKQEVTEISGICANKPELHFTQTGKAVTNFGVYENKYTKDEETGKITKTSKRTRVTCWEDLAEACCDCLDKGVRVTVKGILRPHSYTNRQGEKRDVIELVARDVQQPK